VDLNSSVIGIWLEFQAPWRRFTKSPSWVGFVRLDDKTGSIQLKETELRFNYLFGKPVDSLNAEQQEIQFIRSNYQYGNQLYLLNAEPGRYAVVAAVRERQIFVTDEIHYYFSEELTKLTEVTVSSGEIAFMGAFTTDSEWLQISNAALRNKFEHNSGAALAYLSIPYQSDRGDSAREAFLLQMKEHFKVSAWAKLIEKSLVTPHNSAPQKDSGRVGGAVND
jgi:hypothetical protein